MPTLLRTARQLLIALTCIYCVAALFLLLLWTVIGRTVWWLGLLNVFALLLFTPLLVLIPAALLIRSWTMRAAVALMLLLFLFQFGAQLMPATAGQGLSRSLRVATLNLHFGRLGTQLDDLIVAVRSARADVVVVQELSPATAQALQQYMVRDYPYQLLDPSTSLSGMGIISRYPLDSLAQAPGVPSQSVLLRANGQQLTLINVSLTAPETKMRRLPLIRSLKHVRDYDTIQRSREIELLVRAIDATRGPIVVLGDFNLSDREPDYALFAARLHDAYHTTSWGFGNTFPNGRQIGPAPIPFPLIRIDYVWSGGGVLPAAAEVSCTGGSDHCMVIADLEFADAASRSAPQAVPALSAVSERGSQALEQWVGDRVRAYIHTPSRRLA